MVRIRLTRRGKKRQPLYRVIVADQKSKRDGRFIEHIGNYNPHTDPPTFNVDEARALHWLSVGAQPSDPVRRLLDKQGTLDRLKRLHAGEELDALVAEFVGPTGEAETEAEEVVEEVVEEAAEAAEETVEEAVEDVVEETAEAAEEVADAVENAAEEVAESAEETTEE
ncbi:MAG: 30S ribosomal protein S16 [Chloroflexota bacterium]